MQTLSNATVVIKELWELQHPIINKWFMFSGLSIVLMFTFLIFAT